LNSTARSFAVPAPRSRLGFDGRVEYTGDATRAQKSAKTAAPSSVTDASMKVRSSVTLMTRDADFDRFRPFLGGWRHVAPWPTITF
jgi:hypothetical protein